MRRFEGYTALVTGSGSGIGAATARRLAAEGARVLVTDIDLERATRVAEEIESNGEVAVPVACDVTDQRAVNEGIALAVRTFGGLDVLVNNAFSAVPADPEDFADIPDEQWLPAFDATLHGAFRCTRAAMPYLAAAADRRGAVVNIGSVNGEQDFGGHAYSAAKAALASLTRTLGVRGALRGVRVNLVAPGTVSTPVWADTPKALESAAACYPLGRVGRPEDIAAAVAYLASSDASWVTGVTLPVDGGILVSNLEMRSRLRE